MRKFILILMVVLVCFSVSARRRSGRGRYRSFRRTNILDPKTIMKEQLDSINTQSQINRKKEEEARRAEVDRLKHEIEMEKLRAELRQLRGSGSSKSR